MGSDAARPHFELVWTGAPSTVQGGAMGTTPTAQCGCFGAGAPPGTGDGACRGSWGCTGSTGGAGSSPVWSQQDSGECVCSRQGPPARCHSAPKQLLPVFPIKHPSLPQSCLLGVSEEGLGGIPQWGRDWRGAERALAWIRNREPQESLCPPSHPALRGLVKNLNPNMARPKPQKCQD